MVQKSIDSKFFQQEKKGLISLRSIEQSDISRILKEQDPRYKKNEVKKYLRLILVIDL